jgi:hypothetical protein
MGAVPSVMGVISMAGVDSIPIPARESLTNDRRDEFFIQEIYNMEDKK